MRNKKEKPLSLRMAAYTRLHLNKDFATNWHFALRASLFHVLNLKVEPTEDMRSYEVNGAGSLGEHYGSSLNNEKIEMVFAMADREEYATEKPLLRSSDNATIKLVAGAVVAHVAPKYLPLLGRLDRISGGEWQLNTEPENLKALRFVVNGKTEALLMQVKPKANK